MHLGIGIHLYVKFVYFLLFEHLSIGYKFYTYYVTLCYIRSFCCLSILALIFDNSSTDHYSWNCVRCGDCLHSFRDIKSH